MFELHPQLAADTFQLAESELNLLLLMNDSQFPWCILVPKRESVRELFQLPQRDQYQMTDESSLLAETLMDSFQAHKINVAALGNMVPQLHVHHIARYTDDPCWPRPVWGQAAPLPYDESAWESVTRKLRTSPLDHYFTFA
ncbi:MAG: HIT family protein [Ketobacteraceae bacterium]|nr:HIT family protein [Ketobacteraceae bacterium]